jgi:hypothetical protein
MILRACWARLSRSGIPENWCLLRCVSPVLAHRFTYRSAAIVPAFGGIADMEAAPPIGDRLRASSTRDSTCGTSPTDLENRAATTSTSIVNIVNPEKTSNCWKQIGGRITRMCTRAREGPFPSTGRSDSSPPFAQRLDSGGRPEFAAVPDHVDACTTASLGSRLPAGADGSFHQPLSLRKPSRGHRIDSLRRP